MLHENALGLSRILWRQSDDPQSAAQVILERSDRRKFGVKSRSPLSLYLVLLRGTLKMFLVRDVFNRTFTGFLCNPIRRTESLSVDYELQHLALSKIVGKVPYKVQTQRGLQTRDVYHFVVGEPVPYLQGEDDTEMDGDALEWPRDASGRSETMSSSSHEY